MKVYTGSKMTTIYRSEHDTTRACIPFIQNDVKLVMRERQRTKRLNQW